MALPSRTADTIVLKLSSASTMSAGAGAGATQQSEADRADARQSRGCADISLAVLSLLGTSCHSRCVNTSAAWSASKKAEGLQFAAIWCSSAHPCADINHTSLTVDMCVTCCHAAATPAVRLMPAHIPAACFATAVPLPIANPIAALASTCLFTNAPSISDTSSHIVHATGSHAAATPAIPS
jgi:hypothetical protein